jgi:hypothetical protein
MNSVILQFELTPAAASRFNEICDLRGTVSPTVLFRDAVRLLAWYEEKLREGYSFVLAKDGIYAHIEPIDFSDDPFAPPGQGEKP